jgi:DNA-binding PadR family transcriptional regulator
MSSTRLLVLGAIRIFQPVHGYDVRRELLTWKVDQWANVAPGSIYNALKSLTKEGMLEVVGTNQVGGRPERTTYRLTPDGEAEFQALLRDAWWNVRTPLDPLMPALSFLPMMRKEELLAALRHRMVVARGMLEHMNFAVNELPTDKPEHIKEFFRLSAARVGAEIDWARALSERLERGEYPTADTYKPGKSHGKKRNTRKSTRSTAKPG